jgi:hypothetical protein
MELSIFKVSKITKGEIKTSSTGNHYRSIFVYTEDGEEFELAVYAKKINSLLVKNESI